MDTSANVQILLLKAPKHAAVSEHWIKSFQKIYLKNGTLWSHTEFLMNKIDYKIQPKLLFMLNSFIFFLFRVFPKFVEIKPKHLYCSFKLLFLMQNGLFQFNSSVGKIKFSLIVKNL